MTREILYRLYDPVSNRYIKNILGRGNGCWKTTLSKSKLTLLTKDVLIGVLRKSSLLTAKIDNVQAQVEKYKKEVIVNVESYHDKQMLAWWERQLADLNEAIEITKRMQVQECDISSTSGNTGLIKKDVSEKILKKVIMDCMKETYNWQITEWLAKMIKKASKNKDFKWPYAVALINRPNYVLPLSTASTNRLAVLRSTGAKFSSIDSFGSGIVLDTEEDLNYLKLTVEKVEEILNPEVLVNDILKTYKAIEKRMKKQVKISVSCLDNS